jgi:hypothetical protein
VKTTKKGKNSCGLDFSFSVSPTRSKYLNIVDTITRYSVLSQTSELSAGQSSCRERRVRWVAFFVVFVFGWASAKKSITLFPLLPLQCVLVELFHFI